MSILCKMFGHQPPVYGRKGWWSPGEEYAVVHVQARDGIGREHATVNAECPRCGKEFRLCRIHIPRIRQTTSAQAQAGDAEVR